MQDSLEFDRAHGCLEWRLRRSGLSRFSPRVPTQWTIVQHVPGQQYDLGRSWVVTGDCLDALADLPTSSVDLVFADPPYYLQLQKELRRPNNTVVDGV